MNIRWKHFAVRGVLGVTALFTGAAVITAVALPPLDMSRFERVSPTVQARDAVAVEYFSIQRSRVPHGYALCICRPTLCVFIVGI